MKILITSYASLLEGTTDYAVEALAKHLPDADVSIKPYIDTKTLIQDLEGVDGLLTYFIPIDDEVLSAVPTLKMISIGSTGYSNIDLDSATRNGIYVSSIKEYCTQEVADHTMALMLALARKLPAFDHAVRVEKKWDFAAFKPIKRLSAHTLAIYGLGRIGQAVAKRAIAFGMNVIAYDPYISETTAAALGVKRVDNTYIQKHATIISNHMNATAENTDFFNADYFEQLENPAIFINVSRGQSVDETALLAAIEMGQLDSAGLDVLKSEAPDPVTHPLIGKAQILVTPHAAFYSEEAIHDCDHISVMNLIYALKGEHDKVFAFLNDIEAL
jgi:D-3-phosphoglycerate dehydrogenase